LGPKQPINVGVQLHSMQVTAVQSVRAMQLAWSVI
jgi:hypothetical protein